VVQQKPWLEGSRGNKKASRRFMAEIFEGSSEQQNAERVDAFRAAWRDLAELEET